MPGRASEPVAIDTNTGCCAVSGNHAEEDHGVLGAELDAGHAAGGAALRAHGVGGKAQQLGAAGHEDQVGLVGGDRGADDRVLVLERDRFPLVAVQRVVRGQPLDHAVGGAQRDDLVQRHQRHHLLALGQLRELGDLHAAGQLREAVGRGQQRQVDDLQAQHAAGGGDAADFPARRGGHQGTEHVVLGAGPRVVDRVPVHGAGHLAGGRKHHPARVVRDLQAQRGRLAGADHGRHGGALQRRAGLGFQQHGAARGRELLAHFRQLGGDQLAQHGLGIQDGAQLVDRGAQLLGFLLQLDAGEAGELAQAQLQDVVGLQLGQVVDLDQAFARLRGLVGGADDRDDLVDVDDRDEQALDQVQAVKLLLQAVFRCGGCTTLMRCST